MTPLLDLKGIVKTFPSVRALDGIDFTLLPGEVHVLLGQNGAGKSTLMKILGGIQSHDGGTLAIQGQTIATVTPEVAAANGIALVHQELCLVPSLSIAENILLGRMPRRAGGMIDWPKAERIASDTLGRLGVSLDPRRPVGTLEVAGQQIVEIAKALARDPRIILFDEPTSALSDSERGHLFRLIAALKAQGVGIIYISHHLAEVPLIGDRVTVLRDGRVAAHLTAEGRTERELAELMVGRNVGNLFPKGQVPEPGAVALSAKGQRSGTRLLDVSLDLRKGEILGVFGLMGAGQAELARALFGLDPLAAGSIAVDGVPRKFRSPADAIAAGLGLISRDRRASLVPKFSAGPNISLPWLAGRSPLMLLDQDREGAEARRYVNSLRIEPPLPDREVMFFSGGNQQKVVLARWMSSGSRIVIFDEPARGIDVGAKAEVFALMGDMARAGAAILMISSEPAEIEGMADRTLVLRKGRIAAELGRADCTQARLLEAAG